MCPAWFHIICMVTNKPRPPGKTSMLPCLLSQGFCGKFNVVKFVCVNKSEACFLSHIPENSVHWHLTGFHVRKRFSFTIQIRLRSLSTFHRLPTCTNTHNMTGKCPLIFELQIQNQHPIQSWIGALPKSKSMCNLQSNRKKGKTTSSNVIVGG